MNEQQIKLLEKLAEKLGTTVEHLWSVLVKQALIDAITGCASTVFILVLGFIALNGARKLKVDEYGDIQLNDKDTSIPKVVVIIACFVLIITGLFCATFDVGAITTALLNPEYYAFKQIVK